MKPVVVTVVGPSARRDLSLPADVAVGNVLSTLIQLTGGGGETSDWRLADAGGRVLQMEETFASAGVGDGAVVVLDRRRMAPGHAVDGPSLDAQSDGLDPTARTRRLLPNEPRWRHRLGEAVGALFSVGEGIRPGPLTRLRRQWRDSAPEMTLARAASEMAKGRALRIGVVSAGSGAGATLVTRLLASRLADTGHGRTVAVDTDHVSAALSRGATSPKPLHLSEVGNLLRGPALSYSDVERRIARDDLGVGVVVSTPGGVPIDPAGLGDAIDGLSRHCGVMVVDAGRVGSATAQTVLAHVDLTVLVTTIDEDEAIIARAAGATLSAGRPVVTVVNRCSRSEVPEEISSLLGHSSAILTLPSDVKAAGLLDHGHLRWLETNRRWRIHFLRLAAVITARLDPAFNGGER
ncbi:MAG: hypothetical protein GEU79_14565 [Acidimicrobiia bacterium]|nr:hypothetical protein [Acidimicrobiia bacterium]